MKTAENTRPVRIAEENWSANTNGKSRDIRKTVENLREKATAEHGNDIKTQIDVAHRDRSLVALFKKWAFGTDNLVRQTFSRIADVENAAPHIEEMSARIVTDDMGVVASASHNDNASSDTELSMKKIIKSKSVLRKAWDVAQNLFGFVARKTRDVSNGIQKEVRPEQERSENIDTQIPDQNEQGFVAEERAPEIENFVAPRTKAGLENGLNDNHVSPVFVIVAGVWNEGNSLSADNADEAAPDETLVPKAA
jgi:hypothetical protein